MTPPAARRSPHLVVVTGLPGTGKSTVAEWASDHLGAPVLSHDWAMSGLRPYAGVQDALDQMNPPGHGTVGWSILAALARSQLRRGTSVILDGVARSSDIERCGALARDERATLIVVLTECADPETHRARVEGRQRFIPNWYELDWDDIERSRATWVAPEPAGLRLQATEPLLHNREALIGFLTTSIRNS
jgi:predicted kinase